MNTKNRNYGIDALRIIAMLMVVFLHVVDVDSASGPQSSILLFCKPLAFAP